MARFDTPIPINIIPEADRCLPLFVPDDPAYIVMLVEHLRKLTNARMYVQDNPVNVAIVQDQWRERMYAPLMDNIVNGNTCADEGEGENLGYCYRMDTTTNAIQFYYNNPFNRIENERPKLGQWERYQDSKDKAPDWLNSLLEIAGNIATLDANAGYYPNDVFLIPPDSVNPLDDFLSFADGLLNLELPYMRIDLQGTGRFEIELLSIPLGGSAVVRWDTNTPISDIISALFEQDLTAITNTKFVELQRDFTQIPPETQESVSVAINFETTGEHFVEVFILPKFDYTAITFLGMGGGVRGVTACGELSIIGGAGEVINSHNYGLETHRREGVIGVATEQDFYDALIRYENQRAKRWLLGFTQENFKGGVKVDADSGDLSAGTGLELDLSGGVGSLDAYANDIRNGQTFSIAENFTSMLTDIKAWRDAGETQSDIEARLIDLYAITNPTTAVALYFANAVNDLLIPSVSELAKDVYEASSNAVGVAQSAYNDFTGISRTILLAFNSMLSDDNFDDWEREGESIPRDEWRGYPSTLKPPVTFDWTYQEIDTGVQQTTTLLKASTGFRRMRIEISGSIVADDGIVFDGLYLSGNPPVLANFQLRDDTNNVNRDVAYPSPFPAYNQKVNGKYSYTFVRPQYAAAAYIFEVQPSPTVYSKVYVSGAITMTIYDLGDS